jgi:DNA-binding Xre family transcriptional regulator
MSPKMSYRWLLRERMAERGWWKTTDLAPHLAERGIDMSAAQIWRLVSTTPERLSLEVLAALCDIFECSPNELIEPYQVRAGKRRAAAGEVTALRAGVRPRRARVAKPSETR